MRFGWKALGVTALLAAAVAACSPVSVLNLMIPRSGFHIVRDLPYGHDPRQMLDLYVPDNLSAKAPATVFLYGSSWQTGSKELYLGFGQAFASEGFLIEVSSAATENAQRAKLRRNAAAFASAREGAGSLGAGLVQRDRFANAALSLPVQNRACCAVT